MTGSIQPPGQQRDGSVGAANIQGNVRQRVDAVASAFFFSPDIKFVTFQSTVSFEIAKTAKHTQELKELGQKLADVLNRGLHLEGRISEFSLVSGRFVYYPVDQLDLRQTPPEPIAGAKPITIFIPELLRELNPHDAKAIQDQANAFAQRIYAIEKKPPIVAFQIGPERFGLPQAKPFEQLQGKCKALDKILSIDGASKPDQQVDQVISSLEGLNFSDIDEEIKERAKKVYELESRWNSSGESNVGKILALLNVDLNQLKQALSSNAEKEVTLFSVTSKTNQKKQKIDAIERFIAECKGYRTEQESLRDFYTFFKGKNFPYIIPTGIFMRMGGLEEFSIDEEMDRHATLYGAGLEKELANWMKTRSSWGYRRQILEKLNAVPTNKEKLIKARALVDFISQEVESYQKDILKKSESECKNALKTLLEKDFDGIKIHELSGMEVAVSVISRIGGAQIGPNFLDFAKYYLSLKVLNEKKVLSDLDPKKILAYLNTFLRSDAGEFKDVQFANVPSGSNHATFPYKGKKFELELKKIAFEIYCQSAGYPIIDGVPKEVQMRWFEKYQNEGGNIDFNAFIEQKRERFEKAKVLIREKMSPVEDNEVVFLASELEKKYHEQFPGHNDTNFKEIFDKYQRRKIQVERFVREYKTRLQNQQDTEHIRRQLEELDDEGIRQKVVVFAIESFDLEEKDLEQFVVDCQESLVR